MNTRILLSYMALVSVSSGVMASADPAEHGRRVPRVVLQHGVAAPVALLGMGSDPRNQVLRQMPGSRPAVALPAVSERGSEPMMIEREAPLLDTVVRVQSVIISTLRGEFAVINRWATEGNAYEYALEEIVRRLVQRLCTAPSVEVVMAALASLQENNEQWGHQHVFVARVYERFAVRDVA